MERWLRELKYKISRGGIVNNAVILCIVAAVFVLVFKVLVIGNEIGLGRTLVKKVFMILSLIIAFSVHEFAHAFAAYLSGDRTAKDEGRLTLNIFKHLDPIGIFFPVFLILIGAPFIFGWARPVPVNYMRFKNGRLGEFLVAIAGVMTNFLMGLVALVILRLFPFLRNIELVIIFIESFFAVNVSLGIFNLLPIPPLDGSRVIGSLLEGEMRNKWFSMDRYGYMIIFISSYIGLIDVMITPMFSIVYSIYNFILRLF
ncbi:site-2 protease family protein [Fusobacterium sp. PH5-44]|uniref:site-2 protease family protein n=1 Tax=unclassified Fusobacterium TaxID=2648384 RepID=UPI003D1B6754